MPEENKQLPTPAPAGLTHDLNPHERALLMQYYGAVAASKARIYDLQIELETANKELTAAQAAFSGASAAVTGAHGMTRAQVSADFNKITQQ